ncbi:MAG: hypothetical protein SOW80_09815 [Anaerovoracaceae bacterium]|nr:hypothetical protein [Anaerovoracaceae bacterium]
MAKGKSTGILTFFEYFFHSQGGQGPAGFVFSFPPCFFYLNIALITEGLQQYKAKNLTKTRNFCPETARNIDFWPCFREKSARARKYYVFLCEKIRNIVENAGAAPENAGARRNRWSGASGVPAAPTCPGSSRK